jgi:hypothetical protein
MLFVQTFAAHPSFPDGDDRVKCLGRAWREQFSARSEERMQIKGTPWFVTGRAALYGCEARRWWLVECENAEMGRRMIAMHEATGLIAVGDAGRVTQRILASGGSRD